MARRVLLFAAVSALCGPVGAEDARLVFHVSTREAPPLPEAERRARQLALDGKRKEAEDVRKSLERRLREEHGRDMKAWPQEKGKEFERAVRSETMATLERLLVNDDRQGIADSAADLKKALAKLGEKMPVALAPDAKDATLAVEVMARKSRMGPAWLLYLKVTPRAWLDPARLPEVSFAHSAEQYGYLGLVTVAHPYEPDAPYWILEAAKMGAAAGSWKEAASYAADALVAQARAATSPKP